MDIVGRVRALYEAAGSGSALTLVRPGGSDVSLSYREWVDEAARWARLFDTGGVPEQARVIVILDHGLDLHAAFLGALLGGRVPSFFAEPSDKQDPAAYRETLGRLLELSGARCLVIDRAVLDRLPDVSAILPQGIAILSPDRLGPSFPWERKAAAVPGREVAFVQYSSGTTGLKKAVEITHEALLWQVDAYAESLALAESDRIASWLPLYHDMGLITAFFLPLLRGVPVISMSPFAWVRQPGLLTMAIQRHRATLCWQPNFAYGFLAERIGAADDVDLSSVRLFVNCSEPVMKSSHRAFAERFVPHGLRREALGACYAMAETTFAITGTGPGPCRTDWVDSVALSTQHDARAVARGAPGGMAVESCGRPLPGTDIVIKAGEEPVGDRRLGEIWVRSPSLMAGYQANPEATRDALIDGWLRTGDIGYCADGELFVVGRIKDVLILAGKNVFPQDIEEIVNAVDGTVAGRCVAFSVPDRRLGTEGLVVVAESREEAASWPALAKAVFERISGSTEIVPRDVRIVPHMWLQKSTSGKMSRGGNRERYLRELVASAKPAATPRPAGEQSALDIARRTIHALLDKAGRNFGLSDDVPLVGNGYVDSLGFVEMLTALEAAFGVKAPRALTDEFQKHDSIGGIATIFATALRKEPGAPVADSAKPDPQALMARRRALVPQFADSDPMPLLPRPYLMQAPAPRYRSPSATTDDHGFRTSLRANAPLGLAAFRDLRQPRGAVVGNSQVFGTGASSDATVFHNLLNGDSTGPAWYNFGLRNCSMMQELLALQLYAPLDLDRVVWLSGVISLTLTLSQPNGFPDLPPFPNQDGFMRAIAPNTDWRTLDETVDERYGAMIADTDRIFACAARLFGAKRISFFLQPFLPFMDKPPSPEEVELEAIFYGLPYQTRLAQRRDVIGPWRDRYRADLARLCGRHGIDFVDLNQAPEFATADWLFVDIVHLTDAGHRVLADIVQRRLGLPKAAGSVVPL